VDKKSLRKIMKERLAALSDKEIKEKSEEITDRLFMSDEWKQAKTIGITISRPREVDTKRIIEKAWKFGKKVAVPKCYPEDKTMVFRLINSFSQLENVYYNLFEPIEKDTEEINKNDIDLIIVPGLAFSERGERLGFGGGYYDRFLMDYNNKFLSLAFDIQIISMIPMDKHDIIIPKIITESHVYSANNYI